MARSWNVSGSPRPVGSDYGSVYIPALKAGLEDALADYAGTSDPSAGAPAAWGTTEVGYKWLDTTDPLNPVLKRWQLLTSPSTYGWRPLRLRKRKDLVTPAPLTLAGSPAAADVAYADYDFSADLLDGSSGDVVDAEDLDSVVVGVYLRVVIQTGASETIGTGATKNAYMKWRGKGTTRELFVRAAVANHEEEATIYVPLDANQIAEWGIVVGGGTKAFAFSASIVGFEMAL